MIIEKAYAKLNLTLKVLEKTGGYHMLETLMVPTDFCDVLTFEKRNDDLIKVYGIEENNNSVYKAAKLIQDTYHTGGVNIRVEKNIYYSAGLGGPSADSSGTLRGLNRLFELNIGILEMEEIAASLGSDNVFMLHNKPAICYGRGEDVRLLEFDCSLSGLIIKPPFGLSTKDVFDNVLIDDKKIDLPSLLDALQKEDYEKINSLLQNDLYEAAINVDKRIEEFKDKIESLGFKAHMTGSGSAFFVLDRDLDKLKRLQEDLKEYQSQLVKIG